MPLPCRVPSACAVTGLLGLRCSTSCAWCSVARRSHNVVVIEVPKAPAVMRAKLNSPEAAGMRSGANPDSEIETSGMKNADIAAPWITVGSIRVVKVASEMDSGRLDSTRTYIEHQ